MLNFEKKIEFLKKKIEFFSLYHPWGTKWFPKKRQLIRSSSLAVYRGHIYDCLVLLYRANIGRNIINYNKT